MDRLRSVRRLDTRPTRRRRSRSWGRGSLRSALETFERLGKKDEGGFHVHRYRAVLGGTRLVMTFSLAADGKIAGLLIVPE